MKKNVEIINVKASFLEWMLEKIRHEYEEEEDRDEMIRALENLADGSCETLMMEMGDEPVVRENKNIISCADLKIFVNEHRVTRDGEEIPLTPKEFDILYFLARNKGEVFTKEQIYQAVWDRNYLLDDSNIMAFIRKIRKKIEPNPDAPEYILTIWGIGYKFNDKM